MKFSLSHKIVATLLSLLVLVSTLSLTVDKHFCSDTLIDVAVFSETDKCCMDMSKTDLGEEEKTKSCCKDEVDVIEGRDDLAVKTFNDLENIQKQILIAFAQSYFELFEDLSDLKIPHKNYIPPKLIQDVYVLHETYLI